MNRQIRTFTEIETDLREGLAWIEARVGKAFRSKSRAKRYLLDVQQVERRLRIYGARSLIFMKSLETLLNSVGEGDLIGQVIVAMRDLGIANSDLPNKIFDALQGPEHAKDGTGTSNSARNLFFELRVLTLFLAAGLKAESCVHPDVKVWIEGNPIHVECKRIFAASNIKNLVTSARNQLRKQIESEPSVTGVIAHDLSRLVTSNRLYVDLTASHTWEDARRDMNALIRERHEGNIRKALKGKSIQGIKALIYFYDHSVFNYERKSFGHGHSVEFVPLNPPDISDPVLRTFHRALNPAS
jgi:hypothetical protein